MTVIALRPGAAEAEAYVTLGRAVLAERLPGQCWDAVSWDTRALNVGTTRSTVAVYFTLQGSRTDPLPPVYADVVKAYAITEPSSVSTLKQRVDAARWLWVVLARRLGPDAARRFDWRAISAADALGTEQAMLAAGLAASSVHTATKTLAGMLTTLSRRKIILPVLVHFATPRPRDTSVHRLGEADEQYRQAKLPPPAVIDALADIYATHATTPPDVLLASCCALLVATGLRVNELLSLPLNPLEAVERRVRLPSGATERRVYYRLRRFKSKSQRAGGRGRPSAEGTYLTNAQAQLARMAIARITALTTSARARARVLEAAGDGAVPIPGVTADMWLDRAAIARLFRCSNDNANLVLRQIGEPYTYTSVQGRRIRGYRVRGRTLDAFLRTQQPARSLVVMPDRGDGRPLMASDALLVVHANFFASAKGTNPLLVERVTLQPLNDWLGGRAPSARCPAGVLSVFRRLLGKDWALSTHAFRHWWVTTALNAGASGLDVARWQGREHLGDISGYDHRTPSERLALVKGAITDGRLRGEVSQMYFALAEEVRDGWLDAQVQAAHVTPLGLCVHDFTVTPCPNALNCARKCPEYLFDPNDAGARQRLVQLERRAVEARDRTIAVAGGRDAVSPQWLQDVDDTVETTRRLLAIEPACAGARSGVRSPMAPNRRNGLRSQYRDAH